MLIKLEAFVRRMELIRPGDRVVCAVSGGADSMALLFAMYLLKEKLDIQVEAAHFNHKLRGAESDGDESFVREFCQRFDIPLYVGQAQVTAGKKGLEAAARDARYAFFHTLPGKIATAHTAGDNAETVLMHMIRGTGLKGLGGIAPMRGRIIRPMLSITRQEALSFLQEYHISYREDSSNATDAYLRNRIRHQVMPLLEAENPRLAENLSAMALRLRADEEALAAQASDAKMEVAALRQLHPAVRSRVLENFLKENGVKEPEAEHISLAEALVFSEKPSASGQFPGGVTVRRSYDALLAEQEAAPVTMPRLSVEPATEIVNTDRIFTVGDHGKLVVRSRQSGDTIRLSGGTKSLKKLFIDRKIPAHLRQQIPVIADEYGVVAVYGIGVNLDRTAEKLPAWRLELEEKSFGGF